MFPLRSFANSLVLASLVAATLSVAAGAEERPAAEVAPADRVKTVLAEAHAKFKRLQDGRNADYIPALAKVDPGLFGIALVTTDGRVFTAGDVEAQFSIQSISKVFTLARVLQDEGDAVILEKIGVDATGLPFNSVLAIELLPERSVNSFVNAGAIATVSLIEGPTADAKWARILGTMSDFAGRPLQVNAEVYKSESDTNLHNQAIAKLLQSYDRLYADPVETVDLYTRQCSVNVSAKDLATMAATLANGGRNPVTRKTLLDVRYVPKVLAVMATAGLYDDTGIWLFKVGLPAKSGVGGGILAVAPGKFGVAAFSPPLDAAGNSVRAQAAIRYVVDQLGGNVFAATPR